MKGFLYTVCVLILALSFTYTLIAQNAISSKGMPAVDHSETVLGIAHAETLGLGIEQSDGSTIVDVVLDGRPVAPEGYSGLLRNYGVLTNSNVQENRMGLVCGSARMGFTGSSRNGWETALGPNTALEASGMAVANNISKTGWKLEPYGERYLEITVLDAHGTIVLSEKGYAGSHSHGILEISDGRGNTFEVMLNGETVLVRGRGTVVQKMSPNCMPVPEYIK